MPGQRPAVSQVLLLPALLVSNPAIKDVPVSMTTVKTSSTPASPSPYDINSKTTISSDNNPTRGHRGHQKPHHHSTNTYVPLGASETSQNSSALRLLLFTVLYFGFRKHCCTEQKSV
ncbi:hypothetical protein D9C73_026786 [Collichthys lucidus]|uniref:Uncharacterized protein n=1 Tax=Collichthys lucidus TaxID=240159 RepID=A0A4U5VWL3_COLLU|nr:hypothetical protein D9C73_026786 [Collichthys lucidus]